MRSILKNKVDEFLKILERDRGEWPEFWKRYKKKLGPILENYEKTLGVSENEISGILKTFERRNLDRFRRYWEENKKELKRKTAYELRKRARELNLSKSDFTVVLVGALGLMDTVIVDGKREKVIVIDLVSLWRSERVGDLPDVVLNAVVEYRRRYR